MARFQFKIVDLGAARQGAVEEVLNQFGAQGWQLVTLERQTYGSLWAYLQKQTPTEQQTHENNSADSRKSRTR